jgi:hypothetical protein
MSATASAGAGKRISALPLAATFALHLLLVLCWLGRTVPRPSDDAAPTVVSVLVPIPSPNPPPPRTLPARPPAAARAAATSVAPMPAVVTRPPPAPNPPVAAAPAAPTAALEEPLLSAPHTEAAEDLLRGARKQAGAIDRELRGGKSGVPREADTPWARFRAGLAAAHVDRSRTAVTESYTGADGVTVYRIRQGDKVYCRATGSVVPDLIGRTQGEILAGAGHFDTLGKASSGGRVNCPIGERDWIRR